VKILPVKIRPVKISLLESLPIPQLCELLSGFASRKAGVLVLTVRQALGGPWAANFSGWAILFFPSTFLVFLFDYRISELSSIEVLLIAVAEHLAAGLTALVVAFIFRKRYGNFTLPVSFTLWILIGVTRGTVGAVLVELWAGADPQYFWRIAFWILIACVWMPLFVYTAAQWEHRVTLTATKSLLEALRDEERKHSIEPADHVHKRLIAAVQSAISPVVEEIRRSLEVVSNGIDPIAMRRIGDQLAAVANEASAIVSGKLDTHAGHSEITAGNRITAFHAAIDFERQRPVLASVLTGIALATITLPIGLASNGLFGLGAALAATGVTTAALLLRALVNVLVQPHGYKFRGLVVLVIYAGAGLLGSLTVIVVSSGRLTHENGLLVFLLPFASVLLSSLITGTVGLSAANQILVDDIAELDHERHDLEIIAQVTEERVRKDLATLMHGTVQGRLSACVMALNFHAAELEQGNPDRVESITRAVLEHLEAASTDLDSLGKTVLADARP